MKMSCETVRAPLFHWLAYLRKTDPLKEVAGEEPPLRAELFNSDQMKLHGAALANTHKLSSGHTSDRRLPRLTENDGARNAADERHHGIPKRSYRQLLRPVRHRENNPLRRSESLPDAALNGTLNDGVFEKDAFFGLDIPTSCTGVPGGVLNPRNTWANKKKYDETATRLVKMFKDHFKKYTPNVTADVANVM